MIFQQNSRFKLARLIAIVAGFWALASIVFLPRGWALLCGAITFGYYIFYCRFLLALASYNLKSIRTTGHIERSSADGLLGFRAETLADALAEPLIFFDRSGVISFINHAAYQRFTELSRNQELLTRFRAPEFIALYRNVCASGMARSIDYSEQGEEKCWFTVSMIPIHQDLFVCHFRDQTQARNLERMRTDFIANASHELRTPLTSLKGFIETLSGRAQNDHAARQRFLGIMDEQAARMSRLIEDLLSLSRLETKSDLGPVELLDVQVILRHVIDTLAPLARELDVDVILEQADALPKLSGNRDALIQLFQNLIENALIYGASGKKVIISAIEVERALSIAIQDFGPGIAPEHLPRLTERFYRVDVCISRAHKGTGLGLAIVKHILTHHGGRLDMRSIQGEGSTFTVVLPVVSDASDML